MLIHLSLFRKRRQPANGGLLKSILMVPPAAVSRGNSEDREGSVVNGEIRRRKVRNASEPMSEEHEESRYLCNSKYRAGLKSGP